MLETTQQKVERMFSLETRQRIDKAGLTVVDKADFQLVMDGYNSLADVNRDLRVELAKLRKQLNGRDKS